jgi:hypothetical protein
MTSLGTAVLGGLLAMVMGAPVVQDPGVEGGRMYGRVLARDGAVYEGYLRWDRNEGSWADFLHGTKQVPEANYEEARALGGDEWAPRERSFELFGLRISWKEEPEEGWSDEALSAVRFGHLRSIEVVDDDRALLVFKSGLEMEMEASSTDLGTGLRELIVDDPRQGPVTLRWRDIEVVDFMPSMGAPPSSLGQRLYGTLTTKWGEEFTGYVAWDVDEIFTRDILDGEEDGRDREISFEEIRRIEYDSDDGARVFLKDGTELVLEDSNDVDDSNRGIVVADPALGQVTVRWDEFRSLVLADPPGEELYDLFDGGQSLFGTVTTDRGEALTGYIRWDNDEEFSWEILDGEYRDIEFDVELGQVDHIQRLSARKARVVLRDGRSFDLEGSNDVSESNKGVFVTSVEGDVWMVTWDELEEVRFHEQ